MQPKRRACARAPSPWREIGEVLGVDRDEHLLWPRGGLSQELDLENPDLLQLRFSGGLRILDKTENPESPSAVLDLVARAGRSVVGIDERPLGSHENAREVVGVKEPGLVLEWRFTHGGDSRRRTCLEERTARRGHRP
jgi:hypothetical protein